jgi:hypothetical protein
MTGQSTNHRGAAGGRSVARRSTPCRRRACAGSTGSGGSSQAPAAQQTTPPEPERVDLVDLMHQLRGKPPTPDSQTDPPSRRVVLVPIIASKPSTGFRVGLGANIEFGLGSSASRLSSINTALTILHRKQVAANFQPLLYGRDEAWLLLGENQFSPPSLKDTPLGVLAGEEGPEVAYNLIRFSDTYARRVRVHLRRRRLRLRAAGQVRTHVPGRLGVPRLLGYTRIRHERANSRGAVDQSHLRRPRLSERRHARPARGHELPHVHQGLPWRRLDVAAPAHRRPPLPEADDERPPSRRGLGLRGHRHLGHPRRISRCRRWAAICAAAPDADTPKASCAASRLVSFEAEYRAMLMANGSSASRSSRTRRPSATRRRQRTSVDDWYPGGGVGVRFQLQKRSRTNFTIDFGFGRKARDAFYVGLMDTF